MTILNNSSATNKKWILTQNDSSLVAKATQIYSINSQIAKVLLNRQLSLSDIASFIDPKLKFLMPNPFSLFNMDKACELIIKAINKKEHIVLFSDYDVDGITSNTLLYKYLKSLNANISTYIPNRFTEGYGLSMQSLPNILKLKPHLVILLDNGSSSHNEIKILQEQGIDVVIVDHHALDTNPPKASAILNPKHINDTSNQSQLCTVGIVFLLLVALNQTLKADNNLLQYLDLVALGTVADMVPLVGLNRAYVMQGLKLLKKTNNIGLQALIEQLNLKQAIDYETIGFGIAPVINAASRLKTGQLAFDLLNTDNQTIANTLANELIGLNKERQKQEDATINSAMEQIKNSDAHKNALIFAGHSSWQQGTVGIIAGRIKEIYNKPSCIYYIDEINKIATASGRSVDGLDLGEIILGAKARNLITKGGGHSQAVGFSFSLDKLEELANFLNKEITKKSSNYNSISTLFIDDIIPINNINIYFAQSLVNIAPFGINFPEPLFLLNNVKLSSVMQIGEHKNHISAMLSDGFSFNIKSICFKALPGVLGEKLLSANNLFINAVVSVKINFYNGREYTNLVIKDIAFA
jgi:single-stranded-DNA-specific exonuclease